MEQITISDAECSKCGNKFPLSFLAKNLKDARDQFFSLTKLTCSWCDLVELDPSRAFYGLYIPQIGVTFSSVYRQQIATKRYGKAGNPKTHWLRELEKESVRPLFPSLLEDYDDLGDGFWLVGLFVNGAKRMALVNSMGVVGGVI